MIIVVTLKEPNSDWNGKNVKRFENISEFYTSFTGKFIIIDHRRNNYSEFLDKISNIIITP